MQVAVIPARAGSKGLKRKNTRLLGGRPLICWSIDEAIKCQFIDIIVISTDVVSVADILKSYNSPKLRLINRPKELCGDIVPLAPVIKHSIGLVEGCEGREVDTVLTLQPTSPFRTSRHIAEAWNQFRQGTSDSLLSVSEEHHSIWHTNRGEVVCVRNPAVNRQWVDPYYVGNGAIFITKRKLLMNNETRVGLKPSLYVMDKWASLDIHTIDDLGIARWYLKQLRAKR